MHQDPERAIGWSLPTAAVCTAAAGVLVAICVLGGCGGTEEANQSTGESIANTSLLETVVISYSPNQLSPTVDEEAKTVVFEETGAADASSFVGISVSVDENPDGLSLAEYYDGNPGVYVDGLVKEFLVDGRPAFWFEPTVTLAGDVIVIIPIDGAFVSIADQGIAFQENGIFEAILRDINLDGEQ